MEGSSPPPAASPTGLSPPYPLAGGLPMRYLAYRRRRTGLLGALGLWQSYYARIGDSILVELPSHEYRDLLVRQLANNFGLEADGGVLVLTYGSATSTAMPGGARVLARLSDQTLVHGAFPLLSAGGRVAISLAGFSSTESAAAYSWLAPHLLGFAARGARPLMLVFEGVDRVMGAAGLFRQFDAVRRALGEAGCTQVLIADPAAAVAQEAMASLRDGCALHFGDAGPAASHDGGTPVPRHSPIPDRV